MPRILRKPPARRQTGPSAARAADQPPLGERRARQEQGHPSA
jgi:hypothetical protein